MCSEYFLLTVASELTPVRHTYTNFTDEWYGPDGAKYTDEALIEEIKAQATEENRLADNNTYRLLMSVHEQNEFMKSELAEMKETLASMAPANP